MMSVRLAVPMIILSIAVTNQTYLQVPMHVLGSGCAGASGCVWEGGTPAMGVDAPKPEPTGAAFPMRIIDARSVGRALSFGTIISRALGPDGSVYVADMFDHTVTRLTPTGELVWQIGGHGQGPGEFQVLYRIAIRQDGHVLAFDRATNQVTEFASDGSFVRRVQLGMLLLQVDGIVALNEGHVMISGVTPVSSRYAAYGVHLFDSELHHLRSMAPVPEAEDPRILEFWGAGVLEGTPSGDVLFTRRIPYEVYRLDANGDEKRRIAFNHPVVGSPDAAYRLQGEGASFSIERSAAAVTRVLRTIEITDGLYLGFTMVSGEPGELHAFTPDGESLGSVKLDEEWGGLVGYDRDRRLLWFSGLQDSEPVLWRVEVELAL